MDHGGLGLGGGSALLAVPSRPASGTAANPRRFARGCFCAPFPQSGRAELLSARRVPNFELVSLHLWHRDSVSVRSRAIPLAAAPTRTRLGARLFNREHRDRRLLQRTG